MNILIDRNIPIPGKLFDGIAGTTYLDGRSITPDAVREADALLIRSVTRVDERLLEGSRVRFVATATIGTDHVDTEYLRSRGIAFASAPGSNADAVADYVVAALLALAERHGLRLRGMSMGIVGFGNVGRRVAARAEAMGMDLLRNDPPLERQGMTGLLPLGEVLRADVVSFHVPLCRTGQDATFHLCNGERLAQMRPGTLLINSSRGAVVETGALKEAIRSGRLRAAVLDVWEHEPAIDPEALRLAAIATPHIAGHSLEGKRNGALMVYNALCDFYGWEKRWDGALEAPAGELRLPPDDGEEQTLFRSLALQSYDIEEDDSRFRALMTRPDGGAKAFEDFRVTYRHRREFSSMKIVLPPDRAALAPRLESLGFRPRTDGR